MLEVFSPWTNKKIAQTPMSTKEQANEMMEKAYENFSNFDKRLPKHKIIAIFKNAISIIENQKQELAKLAASEGGKPYTDSVVEIERAINGIEIAIAHMGSLEGKQIAMGHTTTSTNRLAFTTKEPIGVVLAISAFNHPFNLAVHQVIPALAVGCPVIIKPASKTPLSAFKLIEILEQAGLPKGYAFAIACDRDVTNFLVSHPKLSFLTFIGSAAVGWDLQKKVANGVRLTLEHGGVAPVIVEEDADFNELIASILKGGFYHAGQVCVSVQRIFVHENIAYKFAKELAQKADTLIVGDCLDPKTQVGPLISTNEISRTQQWVDEARNNGAQVLCGGEKFNETCFKPTVLFGAPDNVKVSQKEVFAPLVSIYSYKDLDEAIKRANSLDVSFQAAIFTKNIDKAMEATKKLNATAVMINDHTAFRVDWMPFGGAKTSGLGLGGINYTMEEMCNEKLMVIKSPSI